jgi:hypothetical protein
VLSLYKRVGSAAYGLNRHVNGLLSGQLIEPGAAYLVISDHLVCPHTAGGVLLMGVPRGNDGVGSSGFGRQQSRQTYRACADDQHSLVGAKADLLIAVNRAGQWFGQRGEFSIYA